MGVRAFTLISRIGARLCLLAQTGCPMGVRAYPDYRGVHLLVRMSTDASTLSNQNAPQGH